MTMEEQQIPETPNPQPGRKVLCIEDEHFISELYTRALTKAEYEVTVIADGQKALSEAQPTTMTSSCSI